MQLNIDITKDYSNLSKIIPGYTKLSREILEIALKHTYLKKVPAVEVSLLLTDDNKIKSLNNEYRKKNKPTNVLSFPLYDDINSSNYMSYTLDKLLSLGDIIISIDTLKKEALSENKKLTDHYQHLLVHGLLHLLGYDHEDDKEAEIMERLEEKILAEKNIPSPYKT